MPDMPRRHIDRHGYSEADRFLYDEKSQRDVDAGNHSDLTEVIGVVNGLLQGWGSWTWSQITAVSSVDSCTCLPAKYVAKSAHALSLGPCQTMSDWTVGDGPNKRRPGAAIELSALGEQTEL
jgi:hypothetical protein